MSAILVFLIAFIGSSVYLWRFNQSNMAVGSISFAAIPDIAPRYEGVLLPQLESSSIEAESYIVGTESGVVLARKKSLDAVPMASLTKVMTALLLEKYGTSSTILLTEIAKSVTPKVSDLAIGETFTAKVAKTLLLIESDNDIAESIATAIGPLIDPSLQTPRDSFISAMNKTASDLGMTKTRYKNPSGLDEMGHFSSAYDLFTLVRFIDDHYPNFWDETANPPKSIASLSGRKYSIKSSSLLVNYPGIIGVKTGLTDEAKGALIIRYRITGFPEDLILVILRSPDRFRDGERLINSIKSAFQRS